VPVAVTEKLVELFSQIVEFDGLEDITGAVFTVNFDGVE
jgi:hypothetical protein